MDSEQEIIRQGQAVLEAKRAAVKTQGMTAVAEVLRDLPAPVLESMSNSNLGMSSLKTESKESSPSEPYDITANIEKILSSRGVPENFLKSVLERPDTLDPEAGYFLYGPCGVGKTHRAVAIMRELIIRKSKAYRMADIVRGIYDARFIPVISLLMRIKSSFSTESNESEGDVIDRLTSPELLVLDDIGTEKVSDWTLQTLYAIIDTRSREKKQTIITSNYSLDEISKRMTDRISSRIRGMCKVVPMIGQDRRLGR